DPFDQLPRLRLELVRERLDEVRATEWVGRVGAAGLVRDQLLRTKRDSRCPLGRQRQRLVVAVRVDGLRTTGDRGQRLDRNSDDVVLRLLGRERRAARLSVEA